MTRRDLVLLVLAFVISRAALTGAGVAALRFLTEALWASLHHHGRITADGDRAVVKLLSGAAAPGTTYTDGIKSNQLLVLIDIQWTLNAAMRR